MAFSPNYQHSRVFFIAIQSRCAAGNGAGSPFLPMILRRTPMPSPSKATTSPGAIQFFFSPPLPPGSVPLVNTSPGKIVYIINQMF